MRSSQAVVTVHDLSTDGRGVAKVDGAACFIAGTFPGDQARVEIDADSEPLSATLLELLTPSSDRAIHPCPHASECLASPWGALGYQQQLAAKQRLVARTLRRMIGEVEVLSTVPSPDIWHYRSRISLTVWSDDQGPELGYQTHAREQEGVSIETCSLARESIDVLLQQLASGFNNASLGEAMLPRRIQLHETSVGAGAMLAFTRYPSREVVKFWAEFARSSPIPGGIWTAQGTRAGIVGHGMRVTRGSGARQMASTWLGHEIDVHPAAFVQANAGSAELVHKRLQSYASTQSFDAVWDLYGGYGALGFALGGRDHPVTVLEVSSYSEQTFQTLAELSGSSSSRFIRGDLLITLPLIAREFKDSDIVVLDPPRSGAHPEVLGHLSRSQCRQIIYLSCNPARLARDLKQLREGGFAPLEIQPYDFFPQTPSIETLVILQR